MKKFDIKDGSLGFLLGISISMGIFILYGS